jgi:putative addiction module killer protein
LGFDEPYPIGYIRACSRFGRRRSIRTGSNGFATGKRRLESTFESGASRSATSATRSRSGGGVAELRIDYGPGYRIYFVRRGKALVILLCGGDKGTQAGDIRKARSLAEEEE